MATPALEETYDLAPAFFDAIDHDWMIRFLEHRIADRQVARLIRNWLTCPDHIRTYW